MSSIIKGIMSELSHSNKFDEGARLSDSYYIPRIIAGDFPKNSEITVSTKKRESKTGKTVRDFGLKINPGFLQTKLFYKLEDIKTVIDLGDDVRNRGQSTAGTLGRAAVGGLTFGVGGAVVGGLTGKNEFDEYGVYGLVFNDGKRAKIKFHKDSMLGEQLSNFLNKKVDLGFGEVPQNKSKKSNNEPPKQPQQTIKKTTNTADTNIAPISPTPATSATQTPIAANTTVSSPNVNTELQKRLAARKAGKPVYSGGLEEGEDRQAELEMALQKARQITKQIKYDDTATDIIVQIQMLAEKFNIDKDSLESAIDDVYNAKNQLESAVYGLDEVFEEALQQSRWDDDEMLDENLRKWFKEKWVRFGPDGKIRGDCARGDDSEGKPKCLPQSKAHSLGKKGRASAAARKRREDPNPERSGKAINVNTKKKSNEAELDEACWKGYHKEGNKKMFGKTYPNCVKNTNEEQELDEINRRGFLKGLGAAALGAAGMKAQAQTDQEQDLGDGFVLVTIPFRGHTLKAVLDKQTNTYYTTNRRADGTGAIIRSMAPYIMVRGDQASTAMNVGPATLAAMKKAGLETMQEGVAEEQLDEKCWDTHKQVGMKSKGGKMVPNCVPKESVEEGHQQCPECGGAMYEAEMMNEKKDACYYKVKSRYKVWPSAYASGALVKCRKKGASNWGTGGKKNEDTAYAGGMGQGGNAGQSYRKYKVKPSGIAQGISETEAVNRNDGDGWHWYDIKPAGK